MARPEPISRRSLIYAGLASLPLAFLSTDRAPAADEAYVLVAGEQASDTFLPVFSRTPSDGPRDSALGFWTGTIVLNGTVDPFVSIGYNGAPGEWASTIGLEADWDTGPGFGQPHITELYWQIVKPDGASRRPMFGLYDRSKGRAQAWYFMIGSGHAPDKGGPAPVFAVNWDNDSSQFGVGLFAVRPNRLGLHPVTTDGVAPDQTRINMYSAPSKGSALSLSFGGTDPESFVGTTWLVQAVGPSYSIVYSQGKQLLKFSNDGASGAIGFLGAEPIVRPVGIGPPASDEAGAIALANKLRSALIKLGLVGE